MSCRRCECMCDNEAHVCIIAFDPPTTLCLDCHSDWLKLFGPKCVQAEVLQAEIDYIMYNPSESREEDILRLHELTREQLNHEHKINIDTINWAKAGI